MQASCNARQVILQLTCNNRAKQQADVYAGEAFETDNKAVAEAVLLLKLPRLVEGAHAAPGSSTCWSRALIYSYLCSTRLRADLMKFNPECRSLSCRGLHVPTA